NGAVPEIIYFNGRRVALGEDLEPIVLAQPAHPGDKILVAVKLLHTVDEKSFSGVVMHIDLPAESSRPNPNDIRIECIAAANVLPALPTPRKDLLPRVEAAVAAIDTQALAKADQPAFDASLRKAQRILDELHPVLSEAHIVEDGNAHIDAAWLWPRTETVDVVRRTFSTALQLMNEYPDYVFSQSAAQYSEWMADKYPDLNAQIKQRVKEGRWEIVGGMWIEPDLNLPDGESQVRQLLVGQRYFHDQYGVVARIGWNPDSFGYNWQLPQIYKRSGLDYFVTQKMHWNDTNQLPFRLFWWESPDGSKVLTYFPTDYTHDSLSPTRTSADFAESAQRNPGTTEHLDLYGIGDHGGGPTRAMLDEGDHWIAAGKAGEAVPAIRYGTAQSYFSSVEQHLNSDSPTWNYDKLAQGWSAPPTGPNGAVGLPTWKDELYFEYHRGIYTTQAKHKANIRQSEVATLDTEKLASFAWLNGAKYPADELTENWKKITFNQFHDLAAGSGIAVIYRDAQDDFNQVFRSDRELTEVAMRSLDTAVDTRVKGDTPIIVSNQLAWPRTGTVEVNVQLPEAASEVRLLDSENQPLVTQVLASDSTTHQFKLLAQAKAIPALGYSVLHAVSAKNEKTQSGNLHVTQTGNTYELDNDHLHLAVAKDTGCVSTLAAHANERPLQFLAPNACGNQLQTFVDKPKNYDAWNIDPGTLDGTMTPISNVASIQLVADGPLRKTIRIQRTWSKSHFTQDISLDADDDFVRVDTTVDWHETHVLLKAAFPLAASGPKATFEIPYGSIERPTTRNNSFEKAQFEVPALRWADLGDEHQGVSILNDSKYGYDALGNTLRLTLLRSPIWPDPDADRGTQHFTYAIYPHLGTWKQAETVHRGYELNDPLKATQVFAHTGSMPATHSFAAIDEKNVILTAVKKAEDSDALVFRMYESTGTATSVHLHVPAGATGAVESNLMEKPEAVQLPVTAGVVTVAIKPYEILTLMVSYPHTDRVAAGNLP
ncbi:MAG: alpha-mannosidase, partial [Janthinobacterium lividum]